MWRGSDGRKGLRELKLERDPLCQDCLALGTETLATEVDHVEEIRVGGNPLDMGNLRSLCKPCHSRKTAGRMHAFKATTK